MICGSAEALTQKCLFAYPACHSLEQEGIHRESHSIVFIWDEPRATVLAFNHTPLTEGKKSWP